MEKDKKNTIKLQNNVDKLLEDRKYFSEKIFPILVYDKDYFIIMGKKSLAKGGAEKLLKIFNLVAKFEVDKETMSLIKQDGVIAYICTLSDNDGEFRGEGRGADNLLRHKSDSNKTIKMAQKRAFVDAVIRTTGLSDIFTQDLEDMSINNIKAQKSEKCEKCNIDISTAIADYCNKIKIQKMCMNCQKKYNLKK